MDSAAKVAIDGLKLAVEQLKKSWGAYRSNYSNAEAVFVYAQSVLGIMEPWVKVNGDIVEELKEVFDKIEVIRIGAVDVQKEVEMANTLGSKLHRFLLADTTKSTLQKMESDLKKLLGDLEQNLRFRNFLQDGLGGQVASTIKNVKARRFWESASAGSKEWSMPFTKFAEFYSSKAASADDVKPVAPQAVATHESRNGLGDRAAEAVDVACRCGPTWQEVFSFIAPCFGRKESERRTGRIPRVDDSKDDPAIEEGHPLLPPTQLHEPEEQRVAFPYTELTKQDRKALLYAMCGNQDGAPVKLVEKDEVVTVSLLNSFVKVYGFPFDPMALPEPPLFPVVVFSTTERLSIANMCMDLQGEFSKSEIGGSIHLILDSVNRRAKAIKEALTGTGDTEKDREIRSRYKLPALPADAPGAKAYEERQLRCFAADWLTQNLSTDDFKKLDQARRAWSFLLQRYMTMWRLGNLTQEMFEEIDFPGTNRIITFLSYCEPLDEANFRIKIKGCDAVDKLNEGELEEFSDAWESVRPKIHSFFRQLLRWKDELDKKADAATKLALAGIGGPSLSAPSKPTRESKAPRPVQFGGIVPPPEAPSQSPVTEVPPVRRTEIRVLPDATNSTGVVPDKDGIVAR